MEGEILYEYKVNAWKKDGTKRLSNLFIYCRSEDAARAKVKRDRYWGYRPGERLSVVPTGKTNR